MRVLFISGTFPPRQCGVGDYAAELAGAVARTQGMQVAVITQTGVDVASPEGVELLTGADRWRMGEFPGLLRQIGQWRPDLVHVHYPSHGFGWHYLPVLLPLACKSLGFRVVQTWHEPWRLRAALRFLLQRAGADGMIFVRPHYVQLQPSVLRPLLRSGLQRTISSAGALPTSQLAGADRLQLRGRYLDGRQRLVLFFGFVYPAKGVEQLFDIADPRTDRLVIAGPTPDIVYCERLKLAARDRSWAPDQVTFTGYLPKEQAADLIGAADAVVLPFLNGGGDWNTSIHGALAQGTLVITTSAAPTGDDPVRNLYTAPISALEEMRRALRALGGRRVAPPAHDQWAEVTRAHIAFYRDVLNRRQADDAL